MPSELSASAHSYDVWRLVGPTVMLIPYARGYSPRDVLYRLWRAVEADDLYKYVFHSWRNGATPFSTQGDLAEFVKMFEPDHGQRAMLIALSADGEKLAGAIWIDDIVIGHRASLSIFMLEGFRGATALEAGLMALDYFSTVFQLPTIWSFTPWTHAANLARKGGFHDVAMLPGFVKVGDETKDLYVLKWTKEMSHG